MSPEVEELLNDLEGSVAPTLAWTETRERIHELHKKSQSFEERGLIIKIYLTLMESVEKMKLVKDIPQFRETLKSDYNLLLISESLDANHNIDPTKLLAVTRREIEAGHMVDNNELHQLAKTGDQVLDLPPRKSLWSKIIDGLHRMG
jgi:hypothetical protein